MTDTHFSSSIHFERFVIVATLLTLTLSWWAWREASSAEFHARRAHRTARLNYAERANEEDSADE
jgi:hypothetical protein